MVVAFVFFGALRVRGTSAPGLRQISAQEQQYAAARRYPAEQTARVLRLLEMAAVHEARGDRRSAFEVYREVLSARQPVDPRSPAYRYAALRAAGSAPR
jgi:hypothetical protein